MTFKEARDTYWKYYISLEDEFLLTGRYVEFDYINNGKTYSMEYLKLFQAICSEVDVVGKILAKELDDSFTPSNNTGINEWWFYICEADGGFLDTKCCLFGEHVLQPWQKYKVVRNPNEGAKKFILDEKAKTPSWWSDYNSVKHNRTGRFERHSINYAKANLRNLFYAFAALYSMEVKLMETTKKNQDDEVSTGMESQLFPEELPFYTCLLSVAQ